MPETEHQQYPRNGRHSSDEWLLGLVREMVVGLLDERDRRYQERFEAQQTALAKVEGSTEKRFESVNEMRKMVTDRDLTYMARSEALAQFNSLSEKMESHEREDATAHAGIFKRFEDMGKRVDTFEGTVAGSRTTLITIAGLATFLVAVIVIGTFIFSGKSTHEQQPPQVIYMPAPAGTLVPSAPSQSTPR